MQVAPVAGPSHDTRVTLNSGERYLLVTGYSRSISGLVSLQGTNAPATYVLLNISMKTL